MLFALTVPADNEHGPQYMEQALAAIHQANPRRLPLDLLFARHDRTVALFCRVPPDLSATVTAQLAGHYPTATLSRLPDSALTPADASLTWSADLRLSPDLFPIRRYSQFDDLLNRNASDPLTAIFASLAPAGRDRTVPIITMTIRPASDRRVRHRRTVIRRLSSPFFRSHPRLARLYARCSTHPAPFVRVFACILGGIAPRPFQPSTGSPLTMMAGRAHDREEDAQGASDKLAHHVFDVSLRLAVSASPEDAKRVRLQLLNMAGAFGQFTVPRMARFHLSRIRCRASSPRSPTFLLSSEELATIFHPATATVRAPAMQVTESRELEPPAFLPSPATEPRIAALGRTKFRSRREPFGIREDDRRRHMYVTGKTGMGKTTLLHQLIASDIQAGRGLALIDPHGDLADAILDTVPAQRTNEVVLFDAGDREYAVAFNPLSCKDARDRPLVASGILVAFKNSTVTSWGPRLEHILRNALLALLETPGTSFLSLQRLLSDHLYRKAIVSRLRDPVVRAFWEREFAHWKPQFQAEAVSPVQNKIGQLLSQPILRAIVAQSKSRLDLRDTMDQGRILIVNLSKGRIGEDASSLLGSLLVSALQVAAMGRAEIPEQERRDFHVYVDEFQNLSTESFATILSEARKYRLSLTLANQYLAQMDEATAAAVFGNVGSLLAFQVGAQDAEVLSEQLGGDLTPRDLMALPRFTAYLRLLIDGMPSPPFSMETLPPRTPRQPGARAAIIRRVSRHRYCRPAAEAYAEIERAFTPAA